MEEHINTIDDIAKAKRIDADLERLRKEQGSAAHGLLTFPLIFVVAFSAYMADYINKSVLILAGCMCLSGLMLHMATQKYPNPRGGAAKDTTLLERLLLASVGQSALIDESMTDMVTKFTLESENIQQSHLLLLSIQKRLQTLAKANKVINKGKEKGKAEAEGGFEAEVMEAIKLGLIKYCLRFIAEPSTATATGTGTDCNTTQDKRIPTALDIVIILLSVPAACKYICRSDNSISGVSKGSGVSESMGTAAAGGGDMLKDTIDMLIQGMKEHMKTDEALAQLDAVGAVGAVIDTDTDIGIGTDSLDNTTTKISSSIVTQHINDTDGIDFDFSDYSDKKTHSIPNKLFLNKFGYKFIMCLGLLASDNTIAQTRIGDRGGILLIVSCLQSCKTSDIVCTWCFWCLINLCLAHPPNKREFFIHNGLSYTILVLQTHTTCIGLYQQGLGLLATIIAPDNNTKMNLAKARETCLANGVFDMLQCAKATFKKESHVQQLITQIHELLMADWS